MRPRPHVSGYFRIRALFFSDTPFVHTHPVNPTFESGNFWIRSPEWKLLNPIFFQIRVDCLLSNSMTLQYRVQSLQSSQPLGYKTTWHPTKMFLLFLLGREFLSRLLNCISFVFEVLYSIHSFSRSSTSSSVQIKRSYLTLVVLLCVLPLLWHIASNKAKYLHLKKKKILTLFDRNKRTKTKFTTHT